MIRTTIYLPLGRAAGLGVSQFDSSRTRAVAAMMPAWHERLQTSLIMGTRNSGYDRAGQNWYQEPPQCAQVLFDEVPFAGGIHDPCCGKGTIVRVAQGRGIEPTGADIEDRADGCFPQHDFFTDEGRYPNIAFNPPNDKRRGLNMLAARLILHGLQRVQHGGLVAALVTSNFLWSQGRYALFARREMELVLILSERPSVPPGEFLEAYGEERRGNGSLDFAWLMFRRGGRRRADVAIRWVEPGKV
jgi:hypothetical protein